MDKLDTKIMLLNNQHLGMVVQWEDRFYKANRAHTYLGKRESEWHQTKVRRSKREGQGHQARRAGWGCRKTWRYLSIFCYLLPAFLQLWC